MNIESVKELHPMFHDEYMVTLRNGTRARRSPGFTGNISGNLA